jgi:hypothetical protein
MAWPASEQSVSVRSSVLLRPAPRVQDLAFELSMYSSVMIGLSTPDGRDGLAYRIVTPPEYGTVSSDDSACVYHSSYREGWDSFTYAVSDDVSIIQEGTVRLFVKGVNPAWLWDE